MSAPGSVTYWLSELKAGNQDAAQHLWERYFQRLVELARNKLQNAPRRAADEEDVAAAWASAWDRIRYLPGETLLDAALRDADNSPVVPPCERTPGYGRFLGLCAVLARLRGEEISIGVERWAELLHVRPNTISIWRQWAVEDGVLQLIRPHCHPARRATEYRVLLDRLPPVRGTL